MQALSGFPAIRCSTIYLKIRRQHEKSPGLSHTRLSKSGSEAGASCTFGLTLSQSQLVSFQHWPGRSWKKAAAAEDEGVITIEAVDEAVEEREEVVEEESEVATVKVKFVLQNECRFGQQFNVVGNIPHLGGWDTGAALPLVWSDGHVWSSEVDIPAGKKVEYKFLLTGEGGELEWQPGPNRSFETVENGTTLVVTENWFEDEDAVADSGTAGAEGITLEGAESIAVEDVKSITVEVVESITSDALIDQEVTEAEVVSESKISEENGSVLATDGGTVDVAGTVAEVPVVDVAIATTVTEVSGEADRELEEAATTE